MFSNIITFLQGKKTYIIIVLAALFNIGVAAGWWTLDSQLWALINTVLGFLGLGSLRAGVSNAIEKSKEDKIG